jgi:hypothetical protein
MKVRLLRTLFALATLASFVMAAGAGHKFGG